MISMGHRNKADDTKINSRIAIKVNGMEVAIPDDVAFTVASGSNKFELFSLANISFGVGVNTIEIVVKAGVDIDIDYIGLNGYTNGITFVERAE